MNDFFKKIQLNLLVMNSKICFYNQVHTRGKDEATFIGSHAFWTWSTFLYCNETSFNGGQNGTCGDTQRISVY